MRSLGRALRLVTTDAVVFLCLLAAACLAYAIWLVGPYGWIAGGLACFAASAILEHRSPRE